MDKVKCLIVDDEIIAQRIIAGYLEDLGGYEIVARCVNALQARQVLETEQVDLLFLDIEMPKLSGLSFLKTLTNPPSVIITTAHREFALEGFELNVLDYLLKPISMERFMKALNKYDGNKIVGTVSRIRADEPLYVKSDKKNYKLLRSEINYVEGMNNYVILHLDTEKLVVYVSLTEMLEQLGSGFTRIHRSYVVNRARVSFFTKELVKVGATELPVGKSYKDQLTKL